MFKILVITSLFCCFNCLSIVSPNKENIVKEQIVDGQDKSFPEAELYIEEKTVIEDEKQPPLKKSYSEYSCNELGKLFAEFVKKNQSCQQTTDCVMVDYPIGGDYCSCPFAVAVTVLAQEQAEKFKATFIAKNCFPPEFRGPCDARKPDAYCSGGKCTASYPSVPCNAEPMPPDR